MSAPIEPQGFLGGVNVVDFGDLRVARGLSRRPYSGCPHRDLRYDQKERRVWCGDCESDIEGFDAFEIIVSSYDRAIANLDTRRKQIDEATTASLRSLAARAMDVAWRSRSTVPCCPHCRAALMPEDITKGRMAGISRELELQRRIKSAPAQSQDKP